MSERALIGTYNQLGYVITDSKTGEQLYEAGNNPAESSSVVPLKYALPLATIAKYCEQTGADMAAEAGVKWGGGEYEPDENEDEDAYELWLSEQEDYA